MSNNTPEQFVEWLFTDGPENGTELEVYDRSDNGGRSSLGIFTRAAVLAQVQELVESIKQHEHDRIVVELQSYETPKETE